MAHVAEKVGLWDDGLVILSVLSSVAETLWNDRGPVMSYHIVLRPSRRPRGQLSASLPLHRFARALSPFQRNTTLGSASNL